MAIHRKRVFQRLLALGIAFGLMGVLGEVVARARFGAPWPEREPIMTVQANRYRGWSMVPGVHYTYDRAVHINSLGLRGPELAERLPDELRVLVLGDSFVYGQGAAEDETIPHYLAEFATERLGRPVTAVNGGHRAYATHQELGVLRELGDVIGADEVLVLWFWNDLTERDIQTTNRRLEASGPLAFDVGEPMEGWPRTRWRLEQVARRSALGMWLHDVLKRGRVGDLRGEAAMPTREYAVRFTHLVKSFKRRAERDGARVRFAIVPDPYSLRATADAPHPSAEPESVARKVLARQEVELIDLHGPLREFIGDGELPVIPFDGHYLPAANRVMAEALAAALAAE